MVQAGFTALLIKSMAFIVYQQLNKSKSGDAPQWELFYSFLETIRIVVPIVDFR